MGTIAKVTAGGATHLIASTAYATCTTGSTTAAKVATIQDSQDFTLINGITIHVLFDWGNSAEAPTLNVNNTGAKPIYRNASQVPDATYYWRKQSMVSLTYSTSKVSTGAWYLNDVSEGNADWIASTGPTSILNKPAIPSTYSDVGAASAAHVHGAITSDGTIAATSTVTIASGDRLVITDSSDSNKIKVSSLTFTGSVGRYLREDGTWNDPPFPGADEVSWTGPQEYGNELESAVQYAYNNAKSYIITYGSAIDSAAVASAYNQERLIYVKSGSDIVPLTSINISNNKVTYMQFGPGSGGDYGLDYYAWQYNANKTAAQMWTAKNYWVVDTYDPEQVDEYYLFTSGAVRDYVSDAITVTPKTTSGTNIANITINGTTTSLYAPTASGGGGTYTATSPISISGTDIQHVNSGVTSGTYGLVANDMYTPTRYYIPSFTIDSKGHITNATSASNYFTLEDNFTSYGMRILPTAVYTLSTSSNTITITDPVNSSNYISIVDVKAMDSVDFTPVILEWSADKFYGTSISLTVSKPSGYPNNIYYWPVVKKYLTM